MATTVRVYYPGVSEVLRSSEVAALVQDAAEEVAAHAQAQGHLASDGPLPIVVSTYETDRAAATVDIRHPAGLGMQAKYGVLTQAAGAAGLEVSGG